MVGRLSGQRAPPTVVVTRPVRGAPGGEGTAVYQQAGRRPDRARGAGGGAEQVAYTPEETAGRARPSDAGARRVDRERPRGGETGGVGARARAAPSAAAAPAEGRSGRPRAETAAVTPKPHWSELTTTELRGTRACCAVAWAIELGLPLLRLRWCRRGADVATRLPSHHAAPVLRGLGGPAGITAGYVMGVRIRIDFPVAEWRPSLQWGWRFRLRPPLGTGPSSARCHGAAGPLVTLVHRPDSTEITVRRRLRVSP